MPRTIGTLYCPMTCSALNRNQVKFKLKRGSKSSLKIMLSRTYISVFELLNYLIELLDNEVAKIYLKGPLEGPNHPSILVRVNLSKLQWCVHKGQCFHSQKTWCEQQCFFFFSPLQHIRKTLQTWIHIFWCLKWFSCTDHLS